MNPFNGSMRVTMWPDTPALSKLSDITFRDLLCVSLVAKMASDTYRIGTPAVQLRRVCATENTCSIWPYVTCAGSYTIYPAWPESPALTDS
jgi:hypothetical protein